MIRPCFDWPEAHFPLRYCLRALGAGGPIAVLRGFCAEREEPVSISASGSSRPTSAEILERANRSIEEATAQCKRIEAWLAEREAPERRQSFTLIQGGRGESDDA
jgi:hypothetical protein